MIVCERRVSYRMEVLGRDPVLTRARVQKLHGLQETHSECKGLVSGLVIMLARHENNTGSVNLFWRSTTMIAGLKHANRYCIDTGRKTFERIKQ